MGVGRAVLAVVGGVVAAGAVIAGIEAIGHTALDGEAVFGAAIAGYGIGAVAGSWVAAPLGAGRATAAVPVLLGVLAAINLLALPHPAWFAPVALLVLAAGWWAGTRLARTSAV